jgi:glycosyltransferase involved in cell wall biosynthesis
VTEIRISVILPNYNSEKYLERCIQSFLDQDYDNKEMIIVDGKSTDSSHAIIQSFCDKSDKVIWVKEKDKNVTDGFNIGLKYVSGEFIGFMASDSLYYTKDIFRSINDSYGIIKFDSVHFNAYSFFLSEKSRNILLRNCNFPFTRDSFLLKMCFVPFENIFFHKNIYSKNKLDPAYNLSSDIEFYLRILEDDILSFFINKPSTINIYDGENLSSVFSSKQNEQWIEVDIKFLFHDSNLTEGKIALQKSIILGKYEINKSFIKKAESWLIELFHANEKSGFYSDKAFTEKYIRYWNEILIQSTCLGIWTYYRFINSPLTKRLNLSKLARIKLFVKCAIFR